MSLDPEALREDFPLLKQRNPPIYFDNACMSLRPTQVINAITKYYTDYSSCAGRSSHSLSRKLNEEVNKARRTIQKFINAKHETEIVFTRNTTESINLVANSLTLKKGDIILTSDKEHNSNLLPWQVQTQKKELCHEIIASNNDNSFNMARFEDIVENNQVKLIALAHRSNLDGTGIPAKEIIKKAHKEGAQVLLDAAQSAPHEEINARSLGADYIAFSGHKMLGPSATGILYAPQQRLKELQTYNVGGETVSNSNYHDATWEQAPAKFEAGLQNYSGILGLQEALKYLQNIGMKNIKKHEEELNTYITEKLSNNPNIHIIGPQEPKKRGGIFSFNIQGINHHEAAGILDAQSVMVRSGMHCAHSWFNKHNIPGSLRASTYLYNTEQEAEVFTQKIRELIKLTK